MKIQRLIIALITLIFIFKGHATAKSLDLIVLFHIENSGLMKVFQNHMIKEIEGTKGRVRSNLNIKIYRLTNKQVLDPSAIREVIRERDQIIFFPNIFLNEADSYRFYRAFNPDNIFIYPYFLTPHSLFKAIGEKPYDLFRIPGLIQDTILATDMIINKMGYDTDTIKLGLREVELSAQRKYKNLEFAVSEGVLKGINEWRKEIKGNVTYKAATYLEEYFKSNTLILLYTAPESYRDTKWIENNTRMEMVEFLKTYYSETGRKIIKLDTSLKSGVNDCKSLPCKIHCCPKYKEWNHQCLKKLNCP